MPEAIEETLYAWAFDGDTTCGFTLDEAIKRAKYAASSGVRINVFKLVKTHTFKTEPCHACEWPMVKGKEV